VKFDFSIYFVVRGAKDNSPQLLVTSTEPFVKRICFCEFVKFGFCEAMNKSYANRQTGALKRWRIL